MNEAEMSEKLAKFLLNIKRIQRDDTFVFSEVQIIHFQDAEGFQSEPLYLKQFITIMDRKFTI